MQEGEAGITWENGSCKDVSRQRAVSTKEWRCFHTYTGLPGEKGQQEGEGKGEEEEEEASALEGAAEEQTAIQTSHMSLICDKPSSQGARSCFKVPADS